MAEPLEYTYDEDSEHLSEEEALERFTQAKRDHPGSLIVLNDLDCGHWQIKRYDGDDEKNAFLAQRMSSMLRAFVSVLKPKNP